MKNLLPFIVMISCVAISQAQPTTILGCNDEVPGWGRSLGTVSFKTPNVWKFADLEWSDVVIATGCQKETYNGGMDARANYRADCRKNLTGFGDLFSWCAIVRFQKQICPRGWRVPTVNDFMLLDLAAGGNGERRRFDMQTLSQYSIVGFTYGGRCTSDGELDNQGYGAYYWAISENSTDRGHRINFFLDGYISPQGWDSKDFGHTVRCVR